ncbi:Aminoacyl-tRNA synthetase class Ic [Penicillium atrosanguineum]|uniref:GPI ethanolamine phosphate transferase 2 n=1 Tax=Penicillium atrosanguineum TaxID=1132637 RepID=A0A9W9QC47_9EURO|nr:Aminoacyl-tRNA synthetase class Ic [Penicillium atrosanguineum]KAJ5313798.1 Aminoacyl-tRNA synthetase class Ic [Penicillium atrosanguineum]KAJ5330971.1 GPI ethanolamine phosphate transferase 2 [Penicillium atrosanguineum]
MAKSIRASVSKRNRANLRKKIAGPAVDARTERLAAKLQELASQPKPQAPVKSEMELGAGKTADQTQGDDKATATGEEMDVDTKLKSQKKPARVQKGNRKPRNSIVFQSRFKTKKGPKRNFYQRPRSASPARVEVAGSIMAILQCGWATLFANLLLPVGILFFSSGFFPYKPLLPGLATFNDVERNAASPVFDKVIFMVVDALRSLIRAGAALPFTAHASSPTVTMPRLKAMTTGSVPSFLDVILNIAESDTTSNLAYQDTWLAQLKTRGDRLVMYGDDTWLKLFPGMFDRADGTTSFFVSDFVEVDHNVTRHVPHELAQSDWSAMIMHYLGLDHIGHKSGPRSPFMASKHQEMDAVVNEIYTAMQHEAHLQSTLLVLCGDHGMNDAGNHGGSSAGETSPALLFISPKLQALGTQSESPVEPLGDMQYYQTVEQADITPTLAGLLGMPIPLNSLGVFIPEFLDMWDSETQRLQILERNAQQLLNTIRTTFSNSAFDDDSLASGCASSADSGIEGAQCAWAQVQQLRSSNIAADKEFSTIGPALMRFSRTAQDVMSSTASNYDVSRLYLGLMVTGIAVLLVSRTVFYECARSAHTGVFLAFMIIGYGCMMFASSYVEEEQQFWYWIWTGWMFYLHVRFESSQPSSSGNTQSLLARFPALATLGLAISQRIIRRWHQTGQKFAAEPDIARTFFPGHPAIFWGLLILTYVDAGRHLFESLPFAILPRASALMITALAFMFKVNFVAADSPELLVNSFISRAMEIWPYNFSLVWQARLVFGGLACYVLLAFVIRKQSGVAQTPKALFHESLNLFLMMQSRATNIPLFLAFRVQAKILSAMSLEGMEVTVTTLILQYMTFFAFGGSNAISSVDLSSAYNGIGSYNVVLVGILTFVSNWAGPIWWASMSNLLHPQQIPGVHSPAALSTFHIAATLVSVMAACTALRAHLFIWTVFSPKYLYTIAWATGNHVAINLLGSIGLSYL